MEALKEEEKCEEGDEAGGEVVPEHGERQARLGHRVPGALDEVLAAEGGNGLTHRSHVVMRQMLSVIWWEQ